MKTTAASALVKGRSIECPRRGASPVASTPSMHVVYQGGCMPNNDVGEIFLDSDDDEENYETTHSGSNIGSNITHV